MSVILCGLLLLPVVLKRTPKPDDRALYSLKAIIDLGGRDDVRFTGSFAERIKSVEGDVVTTDVESRVSVDVLGVVRQGAKIASSRIERLDGTLITPARVDSTLLFGVPRIDRLRTFSFPAGPVEVGSGWWHLGTRDEAQKVAPFASYTKLEGDEKIGNRDTWRASIDAHEVDDPSPVHVKGMVWLDKADGSLVRGQWAIDGYVFGPTSAPMVARYELMRVEASSP